MDQDQGRLGEAASVGVIAEAEDTARWRALTRVEKFDADGRLVDVVEVEGNLLLSAGIEHLWKLARGDAVSAFSVGNARLGVGDSNAAEAVGQTDLQAASNKLRKAMDSGWPKVGAGDGLSANQIEFKATFATGDANFVWAEWGAFNAASAGIMLNRKVQALGTKASGTTWVLTVLLSIA